MDIIVHRGTHQIGGCSTEIVTNQARIFIDMGAELPDQDGKQKGNPLSIAGVTEGNKNCDAVLFTHNHGDHIGEVSNILEDIPLYTGEATKEIYQLLQSRIRNGDPQVLEKVKTFKPGKMFQVKDVSITPLLVDHSAYDAYMFLIEAEGKKILHTGDFRSHGFRGKGLIPTLKKYVGQVDVLITEGTQLSRDFSKSVTEYELKVKAQKLLNDYKYVFIFCSSTNLDRIALFHESTPRGKYFLCDQYQLDVIKVFRKYAGKHTTLYHFNKALTTGKNLEPQIEKRGFCMLLRAGNTSNKSLAYYKEHFNDETLLIYSMWDGYLYQENNPIGMVIKEFKNVEHLHTSGHATKQTIIDVCSTVKPQKGIIPIHIENPELMNNLSLNLPIVILNDGEKFTI